MAQSTFTLIEIVGEVLHNLGEESIQAFNTPLSTKAKEAVQSAFRHINTIHIWDHLRVRIPATNWSSYTATVPMTKLYGIQYGTLTEGFRDCIYIRRQDFFYRPVLPFDSTIANPGRVLYTRVSSDKFAFNPYPTDITTQNRFQFEVSKSPTIPANPTDTFEIPTEFKNMLVLLASSYLAISHVRDTELARLYMGLYETEANNLRSREGNTILNMARTGVW